jgi:hypothetical protein
MVITAIDSGLEQLLRRALPLPADIGDVSFIAPDRSWGAQLSRVTVNLFLFDIGRSAQPARPPEQRTGPGGQIERRPPMPLVQLSYLVSAWAGNTSDEHQLLGDVLRCLMLNPVLAPEFLPEPIDGPVQLTLAEPGSRKPAELWGAIDARLKPSFQLDVTAALSAPWSATAAPVERIEGLVAPVPHGPASTASGPAGKYTKKPSIPDGAGLAPVTTRRPGGALVTEGRPEARPQARPDARE